MHGGFLSVHYSVYYSVHDSVPDLRIMSDYLDGIVMDTIEAMSGSVFKMSECQYYTCV